jgi:hypothetical protein
VVDDLDRHTLAVGVWKRADDLVGRSTRPYEEKVQVWVGGTGAQSAVNHDGGSSVPAEEVDGDPRGDVRRPIGSRHAQPGVRPR